MAYNSVARCRIFVDYLTLWHYYGLLDKDYGVGNTSTSSGSKHPEFIGLNPASIGSFQSSANAPTYRNYIRFQTAQMTSNTTPPYPVLRIPDTANMDNSTMFSGILGHNLASAGAGKGFSTVENNWQGNNINYDMNDTLLINDAGNIDAVDGDVPYDGFTLRTHDPAIYDETTGLIETSGVHFRIEGVEGDNSEAEVKIGSCCYGVAYTLPHSPDLSLSISYETGTKTIETRGGSSLSNTIATPPKWGDLAAWELRDPSQPIPDQSFARNSRRTWTLSFSFLANTDTFPKYNALNRLADTDLGSSVINDTNEETLLDSDDFFSMVYSKVGTAHKFIFQPDIDVNEFAICKFTKNISFQQQAPNLYRISNLVIREVW